MRPLAWAARSAHPLLEELAYRRWRWRSRGTLWKFFKRRWQLQGLLLLLLASILWLAQHGTLWGIFLVLVGVAYVTRCFDETWPEPLEARARQLLVGAQEAQQAGRLNEALRLARTAEALTNYASKLNTEALAHQARLLLLQGHGAEALQALARTSPHDKPSATLRVQAHLQLGESSIALALARRMFAQAPSPGTARLIAEALLQLQRPEEARHFLHLAGQDEAHPPAVPPACLPAASAPRQWELGPPPRFIASWTLATMVGSLLGLLIVELPLARAGAGSASLTHGLLSVLGGLQGGLVGLAQWWVLRRMHPEAAFWPLITALGHGLGLMAVRLVMESGEVQLDGSLMVVAASLSLQGLVATCLQAALLSRWIRSGATWMLALTGLVPLAEFAALGITLWTWESGSLVAWVLYELPMGPWVGQPLLRTLLRGLALGVCGGAILRMALVRAQTLYLALPPRPLTSQYPPIEARTRPCPIERERVPDWLAVAPMRGKLFCPGADAFFSLSIEEYTRLSPTLFRILFVIVPGHVQTPDGVGEGRPQVGMLAQMYESRLEETRGAYRMTVRMLARVRIHELVRSEDCLKARIERVENPPSDQPQVQLHRLRSRLVDFIRSTPELTLEELLQLRDPVFLADLIAAKLELSLEEHRVLLEDLDPDSRIARVCEWLERELLEAPRQPQLPYIYVTPIVFLRAWGE